MSAIWERGSGQYSCKAIVRSARASARVTSVTSGSRWHLGHNSGLGVLSGLLILAACTVATSRPAHGGFVLPDEGAPLSELIGIPFIVDDKQFFFSSFDSTTIRPSSITVLPVNLGLGAVGFDLVGRFSVSGGDDIMAGGASIQFTLAYTVDVLTRGFFIRGANLEFDASAMGGDDDDGDDENGGDDNDNAYAMIMETIKAAGVQIAELNVFAFSNMDQSDWILADKAFFDPQTSISVLKTVGFFAHGDDGVRGGDDHGGIGATFIRQTFIQIPAPGALALLGVAGLAGGRRRRRDRTA